MPAVAPVEEPGTGAEYLTEIAAITVSAKVVDIAPAVRQSAAQQADRIGGSSRMFSELFPRVVRDL